MNLGLETIWDIGCENAKILLKEYSFKNSEFELDNCISMMNPLNIPIPDDDEAADEILSREGEFIEDDQHELEPLSDEFEEFGQIVDSDSLSISKVLMDGAEIHKARALNLLVNCPHRQSRDRPVRVFNSTPIPSQLNSLTNDSDTSSDIRITDTLITICKLKDGNYTSIIITINPQYY